MKDEDNQLIIDLLSDINRNLENNNDLLQKLTDGLDDIKENTNYIKYNTKM